MLKNEAKVVLLVSLWISPISQASYSSSKLKPGVYLQELATPTTFYSTVAPLVFGFEVPELWKKEDLVLPGLINCTSPDTSRSSTCPMIFFFPQMQDRFSEYLFNGQPMINRFRLMQAAPQDTNIQFQCDTLGSHFRDIFVSEEVMQGYLAKLKECSPAGDMEFVQHIHSYSFNISSVYREMKNAFYKEVWLKVHEPRIDVGLWVNAQKVLAALHFLNYLQELARWQTALSDCESHRVPSSLITPDLMVDTLQDLFENVEKAELLPVISAPDVGNYFKSELADCTFTNDTFYVRILVPLLAKAQSYSFYSIQPLASFSKGMKCEMELSQTLFVFDNLKKIAYETSCTPNSFCHVGNGLGNVNPCASALINADYNNIIELCELKCDKMSQYHLKDGSRSQNANALLKIEEVGGDKVLVTGAEEFIVKCREKKEDKVVKGVAEINLSCGCSIKSSNVTFFSIICPGENGGVKVRQGVSQPQAIYSDGGCDVGGGVKFLLVFYFTIILGLCGVMGLLLYKLKAMGVPLSNPLILQSDNVSYNRMGGESI